MVPTSQCTRSVPSAHTSDIGNSQKARQLAGFLFGGKDQMTREKRCRLCSLR